MKREVRPISMVVKAVDAPQLRAIIAGDVPFVLIADAGETCDVVVFQADYDWAAYEVGKFAWMSSSEYGFLSDITHTGVDALKFIGPDHLYVAKLGRRITSLEQIIKEKN